MEKLNEHQQELETLLEELAGLVDNMRSVHWAITDLITVYKQPTEEQVRLLNAFGIRYTTLLTQAKSQAIIERRCRDLLTDIVRQGH